MDRDRQQFLYAEDLIAKGNFQTVKVRVAEVLAPGTLQTADKKLIDKTTLRFEGKDKALILCKTNEQVMRYVTGQGDPEGWVGKEITLEVRSISAFGGQNIAIRVMPHEGMMIRKAIVERLGQKAILQVEQI